MNKFKWLSFEGVLVCGVIAFLGNGVRGQEFSDSLDVFPGLCSNANTRDPLIGHMVRLGEVAQTQEGLEFLFPDQRAQGLQMVPIADNAGIIKQDPDEDLSDTIDVTPSGSFVVAQIFIGDPNKEPVVTCLSDPILLNQYVPENYGPESSWLSLDTFRNYLVPTTAAVPMDRYSRWLWRNYWQQEFSGIRDKFKDRGFREYKHYLTFKRRGKERLKKGKPTGTKTLKEPGKKSTTGKGKKPTNIKKGPGERRPTQGPITTGHTEGRQGKKRSITYVGNKTGDGGGLQNVPARIPSKEIGGGLRPVPSRMPSRQIGGEDLKKANARPASSRLGGGETGTFKPISKESPSGKFKAKAVKTTKGGKETKRGQTEKREERTKADNK